MTATAERPTEQRSDFLEFQGLSVTDEERREISGLLLPYGEIISRLDWETGATRLMFEPGAAVVRENATLFYGHDHLNKGVPIGKFTSHEQTDKGLRFTARISKTAKGDEVYTLLKDGVLDRLSAGFYRTKTRLDELESEEGPLLVVMEGGADVWEGSVVPDPAYQSATVDSVLSQQDQPHREKEQTMTETTTLPEGLATTEDVQTLAASIDNLERQLATLGDSRSDGPAVVVPGNSYGEFLQMAARGDKQALDFLAYVGGTVGDLGDWVKDSWVGDVYRPITERRRLHNLFESSPLPSSGMNVEYGKLDENTLDVEEQVNEGDVLAYGKISFTTATAPIKTYGGWSELSRQEIERSSMAVVEKLFSALVNQYAKETEDALRTIVANAANSHPLAGAGVSDFDTADGWIDFISDAAFWLDDKGLAPEFVLVGRDVWKDLAKVRDGDNADAPRLLDRKSGTINIVGLTGELFNLPVIPINSAGLVRVGHSSAIRTFEAGGQPFRLQDDDITNLTKAFSIYGYEAIAVQDKDAIVSADVTA